MELLYGIYARLSWPKDVPNDNIVAIAIAIALSTNTLCFLRNSKHSQTGKLIFGRCE